MKVKFIEQEHRITLKITEVRLSKIQDISVEIIRIKSEFLATHYCIKEMQVIDEKETEIEVCLPLTSAIVCDEIEHEIPFDLWVGLRKSINSAEIRYSINEVLLSFSEQFVNSLKGLKFQIETVDLG